MRLQTALAATIVLGLIASSTDAQIIFSETFDDASSSANFSTTSVSLNNDGADPADVYSEFGFDYSATGSSRLTASIGAAPNGGSSNGLLLAANVGGSNRSSINFYPIINGAGLNTDPITGLPVIGANYKMTFDFFGGVNGAAPTTPDSSAGTGSGTSESLQFGVQSNGDGKHLNGFSEVISGVSPDSDYIELNIAGDYGTSDYIPFTTVDGAPQSGAFTGHDSLDSLTAFPAGTYDYQPGGGAAAWAWAEAEVTHIDGLTTFSFNGVVIEEWGLDGNLEPISDFANTGGVEGLPWFGYTDYFNSQAGGDSTKVAEPGGVLVGDYNGDNIVNAADYTVYRDTLGNNAIPSGSGADGNDNGIIDTGDYIEWSNNYGSSGPITGSNFDPFNANFVIVDNVVVEIIPASSASMAIPEPSSLAILLCSVIGLNIRKRD